MLEGLKINTLLNDRSFNDFNISVKGDRLKLMIKYLFKILTNLYAKGSHCE